MYLMSWKFVCNLRFHEVLQTTIIRQITKENYIYMYIYITGGQIILPFIQKWLLKS